MDAIWILQCRWRLRRTVIYAHPLLGMGIAFREVKPTFAEVLKKWLLLAMQQAQETKSS
jgi:hypothetical protein